MAFEDEDLTSYEKQVVMLSLMYPEMPKNVQAAIEQATKFLNGGKSSDENESIDSTRLCSFSKDANFIFAAFKQTHGVDLSETDMHWWKFMALFMDLGSETTFCSLVSLRKRVKSGKATKEEIEASREMGDVFDLEDFDTRTLEEKDIESGFMSLLPKGAK